MTSMLILILNGIFPVGHFNSDYNVVGLLVVVLLILIIVILAKRL